MAIISKEGLLKVLVSYNPWWKTGVVNPKLSKTYKRFAFYEAMKRLNQTDIRRTVVLTGTRRVGKTTIQYQMIEALQDHHTVPDDRGPASKRCSAPEDRLYFHGPSHAEVKRHK